MFRTTICGLKQGTAVVAVVSVICCLASQGAAVGPSVHVSNIRRVFHNGEHNAFTDLVRFRDQFYLAFRSCPGGHNVHPTASIIILASSDGAKWR